MPQRAPTEGIYFVVRLPTGWQLMPFRFDEHPEGGHPEFWEGYVAPLVAHEWVAKMFTTRSHVERRRKEQRLSSELALHYDGFPRGRITCIAETGRYAVYHGGNLKPTMKVSRPSIEGVFGISGRADWEFDEHEQCSAFSAESLWSLLPIRERWATAIVETE